MNKIKKALISIAVTAGAASLAGGIAACSESEPNYFRLSFEGTDVDYVLQESLADFVSGGKVKEGVEVKFRISVGAGVSGTPDVCKNGQSLTPDGDGVYSFVMDGDSTVSVDGITGYCTLTFDNHESVLNEGTYVEEERRVTYIGEDGKKLGVEMVEKGSDFKFKVDVSVYYKKKGDEGYKGYRVKCGNEELIEGADGYYTVSGVKANQKINVLDLEQATAFPFRKNTGNGTAASPYLISEPIDMFYVAALVNSDYYASSGFYSAHYKLTKDIDMQGEQLFVIGDGSTTFAKFCGVFDGDGHTIKNFYVTDEVVDQESFANEFLPCVGVFGSVEALRNSAAVIKNLNLVNGEVRLHPAAAASANPSIGGLLVGNAVGAEISNCHVQGKVFAFSDDNHFAYTGGIVGIMQSAYLQESKVISYDCSVVGCTADVALSGVGSVRTSGAIAGYVISADPSSIAYVSNCYSKGSVSGAMYSGGIVGLLGIYSSVAECYSTVNVNARCGLMKNGMTNEEYLYAYGGGIVGLAENDTAVSRCISDNSAVRAYAVSAAIYGAQYNESGAVVGHVAGKGGAVETAECALHANVAQNVTEVATLEGLGITFTTGSDGVRKYSFDDSLFYDGTGADRTRKTVKITVGATQYTVPMGLPLVHAYGEGAGKLPEYLSNSGVRTSYGYFLTCADGVYGGRIPAGFIPSADVTFYADSADYTQVAGTYYIKPTEHSEGAFVTLTEGGKAQVIYGAMNYESDYTFDGETVCLIRPCLAALQYTQEELDGARFSFAGKPVSGGITLTGETRVITSYNPTTGQNSYETETISFELVTVMSGFKYGEYRGGGATYVFNNDGTGRYVGVRGEEMSFEFTIDTHNGVIKATFEEGFVWEGLVSGEEAARLNGVDLSYVEKTAEDNPFEGVWFMSTEDEQIELRLSALTADGLYGDAVISYAGGIVSTVEARYDIQRSGDERFIRIFVKDAQYGDLTYSAKDKRVSGVFYSVNFANYYSSSAFYKYDAFRGSWVASSDNIELVTFNGKGDYDVPASGDVTAVRGSVTVTQKGNAVLRGSYSLTSATEGTAVVGGVNYDLQLDPVTGIINMTPLGGSAILLGERDGWYGVELFDGDGVSYRFDGKSKVGGTVTVTASGTVSESAYVIENGTVKVDGVALVAGADGFALGAKTLKFKAGFAGDWTLAGSNGALTATEVGSDFKATLTFGGRTCQYTYNPADGSLSYDDGASTFKITLLGANELNLSETGAFGSVTVAGLRSSMLDGRQGEYSYGGVSWTFDGLGSRFYGGGVATRRVGNASAEYSYKVDRFGNVYVNYDGGKLFIETAEADGFVGPDGSKKYEFVLADVLYDRVLRMGGETYSFDGMGKAYKLTGDAYVAVNSYQIAKKKYELNSNVEVQFTALDGQGSKTTYLVRLYAGTLHLADGLYNKLLVSTGEGGSKTEYVFDGISVLYVKDGDDFIGTYAYVDESGVIKLTDDASKEYTAQVDVDNGTIVITPVEGD